MRLYGCLILGVFVIFLHLGEQIRNIDLTQKLQLQLQLHFEKNEKILNLNILKT